MGSKLLYAKCGAAATRGKSSSFYTTNILNLLFCIFEHVYNTTVGQALTANQYRDDVHGIIFTLYYERIIT